MFRSGGQSEVKPPEFSPQASLVLNSRPNEGMKATRRLSAMDLVLLNHGQVTRTAPELTPPLLTTTPHEREV
ncbi:hypothetical protein TNCV_3644701 [Trichonephila clavipes]|nr:hypothetical protein TNCV_3644701 [Trichonephila clavipes]